MLLSVLFLGQRPTNRSNHKRNGGCRPALSSQVHRLLGPGWGPDPSEVTVWLTPQDPATSIAMGLGKAVVAGSARSTGFWGRHLPVGTDANKAFPAPIDLVIGGRHARIALGVDEHRLPAQEAAGFVPQVAIGFVHGYTFPSVARRSARFTAILASRIL